MPFNISYTNFHITGVSWLIYWTHHLVDMVSRKDCTLIILGTSCWWHVHDTLILCNKVNCTTVSAITSVWRANFGGNFVFLNWVNGGVTQTHLPMITYFAAVIGDWKWGGAYSGSCFFFINFLFFWPSHSINSLAFLLQPVMVKFLSVFINVFPIFTPLFPIPRKSSITATFFGGQEWSIYLGLKV